MHIRPADREDIDAIAQLIAGEEDQATTTAAIRLFGLRSYGEAVQMNRVVIESNDGWRSMAVAERSAHLIGVVQVGDPFLAFTSELMDFAEFIHGPDHQAYLGHRLEALARVQVTYPDNSLRISEIHVAPQARNIGVGRELLEWASERADARGASALALQTLTDNPARHTFEKWGFVVADTTTDPHFEDLTGFAGYHLMVRDSHPPRVSLNT